MNYFIQYPLFYQCNMHCSYCLHGGWRKINKTPSYQWTIEQYKAWRDKCLPSGSNIVLHLCSGEPSFGQNLRPVERLFGETDIERFDILTNGTCPTPGSWIENKDRIDRITATYHRRTMNGLQAIDFCSNVFKMQEAGLPVEVKELAFKSTIYETLRAKEQWEAKGVPFKIQHYRQMDCEFDEDGNIDEELLSKIDPEYLSYDFDADRCFCRKGFEGIILRFDGRILACWHNQKVIGNIQEGTYQGGAVTYKYVAKSGKTRCRVCVNGESFDRMLGPTLGDLLKNNRREQGMAAEQTQKVVSIEAFLFSAQKRLEDAVGTIGNIVNELQGVIESQDARIRELNCRQSEKAEVQNDVLPALAKAEGMPGQRQG